MDPDEYEKLRLLAEREGLSVAEAVRQAVEERYMVSAEKTWRQQALEKLFSLPPIVMPEWSELKKELADRRGALLF